jgi:hypothetical protein
MSLLESEVRTRHAQRKDHVKTEGKDSCLKAKERNLEESNPNNT